MKWPKGNWGGEVPKAILPLAFVDRGDSQNSPLAWFPFSGHPLSIFGCRRHPSLWAQSATLCAAVAVQWLHCTHWPTDAHKVSDNFACGAKKVEARPNRSVRSGKQRLLPFCTPPPTLAFLNPLPPPAKVSTAFVPPFPALLALAGPSPFPLCICGSRPRG
jgi:hypothetical protein